VRFRHAIAGFAALVTAASGAVVISASDAGAATSGSAVNIALLDIESGVYAAPGRHNDIQLAINQINAAGGVDGHKFQYTPYDTGLTPQQAVTATQQAVGASPNFILGYSVDDQVQASASLLRQSGIPVLAYAQGPAASSTVAKIPNLYTVVPSLVMAIEASTSYAVNKYHPKTVGIFHTEDTASNADAVVAQALLKKKGVKSFVVESASDTATDTTQQVIALKNANLIMSFGFPTVEAVLNTQLAQNGYTGPIIGDQSGNFLAAYGLNTPAELANYTFTTYCYPPAYSSPQATSYTSAFEAAYPSANILTSTAYVYDSVYLMAAAVKSAGGSLTSSKLVSALGKITYKGACGVYHSDANHDLIHQVALITYASNPKQGSLAATYVELPLTKVQLSY